MFKVSILFGDAPEMDPAKIAPGFEQSEIPAELLVNGNMTNEEWEKRKKEINAWHLSPIKVASHWLSQPCNTANADWELLEFWTKRTLRRLSEIGVATAGVYGLFFRKAEGPSAAQQMDQAIRYANLLGDTAKEHDMQIALEPMANLSTLWPTYKEGLAFAKKVGHPNVKVMADLNYFLKLDQPFEDIKEDPVYCLHCHIAGEAPNGAQPNVGNLRETHKAFFRVLRDIGYDKGVSAACPWRNTGDGAFDLTKETAKTLAYMKQLREEVYNE
jgi:sugar phosphate isomerase/epimerase